MKIRMPRMDFQLRRRAGIPNRNSPANTTPPAPAQRSNFAVFPVLPARTELLAAVVLKDTVPVPVVEPEAMVIVAAVMLQVGVSVAPEGAVA